MTLTLRHRLTRISEHGFWTSSVTSWWRVISSAARAILVTNSILVFCWFFTIKDWCVEKWFVYKHILASVVLDRVQGPPRLVRLLWTFRKKTHAKFPKNSSKKFKNSIFCQLESIFFSKSSWFSRFCIKTSPNWSFSTLFEFKISTEIIWPLYDKFKEFLINSRIFFTKTEVF